MGRVKSHPSHKYQNLTKPWALSTMVSSPGGQDGHATSELGMAKPTSLITWPRRQRIYRCEQQSASKPTHAPRLFATTDSGASTASQATSSNTSMRPPSHATTLPTMLPMDSSLTVSRPTEDTRARAAGLYPYGTSIFATLTPTTLPGGAAFTFSPPSFNSPISAVSITDPAAITLGSPSFSSLSSAVSAARPPVSSQPTRVPSLPLRANTQTNASITESQSSAPLAALSALSSSVSAAPSEDLASNALREQVISASTPAALQSATFISDVLRVIDTPFTWPNTSDTESRSTLSSPDRPALALFKHLQDQIQPLKHKTLLEGLLSNFSIPDVDSLKSENKCHVCLETFLTGTNPELPIKLQCGHICGSICIIRWLAPRRARPVEKNCPICRRPIFSIECASEWNALTFLETNSFDGNMLGMRWKFQAMLTHVLNRGVTLPNPLQTDMPVTWGEGRYLQVGPGHDELQWEAWRNFLEDLVVHAESADEWSLWYRRQQLVVPIVSMITVLTFMEMKEKGNVWISRLIIELPELYLPLHSFLDRAHPDYYLAIPREELYRKTADLHGRIEKTGRHLWSCHRPCALLS